MSAASHARSQSRDAAPSPRAPQVTATPGKSANAGFAFAGADSEGDFKLNLGDIPRVPHTMEVEGLKPSLLGRLVGLVIGSK